ncbi:MAG: hypothetical protein ACXADY_17575 [Candidatus Hodarchaeales archaeon]|jgi:hypothetical protein
MKAGRIKLNSPEAFMIAFTRLDSNENYNKDETNNKGEKWSQDPISP